METKQNLQDLIIDKTPNSSVYKCCLLDTQGNIIQTIVFTGENKDTDVNNIYFSEDERILHETGQIKIINSTQLIHLDDSISTIKKKILKEFTDSDVTYDELYLFSHRKEKIDLKSCYENITNNEQIPFTKPLMGQFLNNLQISDESIYKKLSEQDENESYSYNQLMTLLEPYENNFDIYIPLGLNFSNSNDYLFSANPFSILPSQDSIYKMKSNNLLYSFENYLLLNYPVIENNTIYICLASHVLQYGNSMQIDPSYLTSLYFPLLSKKNIQTLDDIEENKQKLLEESKALLNPSFFKIQENIKTFQQVEFLNLKELPYMENGITNFHIIIHPKIKTFIPIDIIFKQLSASEEMPFIKYNPGSKKESLVRLFCNKRTKKGQKIPILSKQNILSYFKNSGKVKQLSVYIKKIFDTQLVECFIDFDNNGNIILRSISNKHVPYSSIQKLISNMINPLIDTINTFIQSSGYKISKFSSLENELIEIIHLDYQLSLQLNPTFDLHNYDNLLYGIFDVLSYDVKKGAELYFKRVNNYVQMNAISAMIAYYVKQYSDPNIIINLISSNFNLTFEEGKNEFIKFQNEHQFINGKYVNKTAQLIDNPGFPTTLLFQPFENKLNIEIKNIDSIKYIPILQSYINTFLRFAQYDDELPINKKEYMKNIKKTDNNVVEPHVENIIIPTNDIVTPIQIATTNIFKTTEDSDDSDDDDALFFDDDSDDESNDDESISDNDNESVPDEKIITESTLNVINEEVKNASEEQSEEKEESPEIQAEEKEESSEEQAEEKEESPESQAEEKEASPELANTLNNVQDSISDGLKKTTEFFGSLTKGNKEEKDEKNEEQKEQKGGSSRMFIKKMKELQPILFKKTTNNEDSYARNCQANSRRQPIILTNEEKLKIDKEYPNSYDIALPYSTDDDKQFWYICPRYWCLKTNAPLTEEQVQNGECGGKIVPQNAKEPPAGHYIVEFTDNKEHIDKDGNYRKHYPGFLKNKTDTGHCLPCCFKKLNTEQQQKMRKECKLDISNYEGDEEIIENIVGKKDKNIIQDDKKIAKNILLPERFPMPQHRWGFLPISAELFLQVDQEANVDKNNRALIYKNKYPLLRYGMEFSRNQSFVAVLNDLYSSYQNKYIPLTEFRNLLASEIDLDLFIQSYNSNLVSSFLPQKYTIDNSSIDKIKESAFYKSLDLNKEQQLDFLKDTVASYNNFITYLLDNDSFIDHTYLWDIVTSGKLSMFPEAFNFIILEISDSDITDDIALLCPTNLNKNKLFDKKLKSVILLKNKEYYEPIYKYGNTVVNKNAGNKTAVKFLSNSDISNELKKVINTIEYTSNKYCKPIESSTKIHEYKTNLPAESILQILKDNEYTVSNQIMNYKSKIIAFSVKIRPNDQNEFYIPTYPSNFIDDINIKYIDDVNWNSYNETKTFLTNLYVKSKEKLPCKPLVKVVEDGIIVGILTLSNQFVAVSDYIENTDDDLDMITTSNYKDDYLTADNALIRNNKKDNTRVELVRNIYLETQFYNSFRNKIRNILNDYYHFESKKLIEELIQDNTYLYSTKMKKLAIILKFITKEHVVFQDFDYSVFDSMEEKMAFVNLNKDNQFCFKEDNKLCLPKQHLLSKVDNTEYYYQKLADELLRYNRVRLFMLNPSQYLTIHHFDYKIQPFEILLLQSSLFDNYFKDLEPFETSSYVQNITFDISNPEEHPPYSNKIDLDSQNDIDDTNSSIELQRESCIVEKKSIKEAPFTNWEKFIEADSEYISFEKTPLCSFFVILSIIHKKTGMNMNILEIKNKLIEKYNELKPNYFIQILSMLKKQGKELFVQKLQKNEIDIESMVLDEEYFLTHLDFIILCVAYNLPVVLFSKSKFKNLSTNLDWMVLGGDTTINEFHFVYGTNENQKTETYLIEPAIPFQEMKAYEVSSKKADFKEHFITIEKILEN